MSTDITLAAARYIAAVATALMKNPDALITTAICSECESEPGDEPTPALALDDHVSLLYDGEHIFAAVDGWTAVIIGCEGYWAIDPNSVGIYSPGWQDAVDDAFAALVEDAFVDAATEMPLWAEMVCFWTMPHPRGECGAARCAGNS